MAALKERNGNMLLVTSVTGKIIRKTVSVYSFTRMVTNMRVFGREIRDMVKAHTGETKEES